MKFQVGDYVVYQGSQGLELGRVASVGDDETYFVCFHSGCTSAATPETKLEPIINSYVIQKTSLGYNRFREDCSSYNSDYCSGYCKEKGIE